MSVPVRQEEQQTARGLPKGMAHEVITLNTGLGAAGDEKSCRHSGSIGGACHVRVVGPSARPGASTLQERLVRIIIGFTRTACKILPAAHAPRVQMLMHSTAGVFAHMTWHRLSAQVVTAQRRPDSRRRRATPPAELSEGP